MENKTKKEKLSSKETRTKKSVGLVNINTESSNLHGFKTVNKLLR